jgi:hypothetical protein
VFYIYENLVKRRRVIHLAECSYCNQGKGNTAILAASMANGTGRCRVTTLFCSRMELWPVRSACPYNNLMADPRDWMKVKPAAGDGNFFVSRQAKQKK